MFCRKQFQFGIREGEGHEDKQKPSIGWLSDKNMQGVSRIRIYFKVIGKNTISS